MLFISGVERFQKTCKTHSDAAHACSTHWVSCDNGPSMAVCIGYCVPVTKAVVISTQQLTPRHWASCFSRMLWYTDVIQRLISWINEKCLWFTTFKMCVVGGGDSNASCGWPGTWRGWEKVRRQTTMINYVFGNHSWMSREHLREKALYMYRRPLFHGPQRLISVRTYWYHCHTSLLSCCRVTYVFGVTHKCMYVVTK